MIKIIMFIYFSFILHGFAHAEAFQNCRCICSCPSLDPRQPSQKVVLRDQVTPSECSCEEFVIPRVKSKFNGSLQAYCKDCHCLYEVRNTTAIMIVVVALCIVIGCLTLYIFIILLVHRKTRSEMMEMSSREEIVINEEQMVLLNGTYSNSDSDLPTE